MAIFQDLADCEDAVRAGGPNDPRNARVMGEAVVMVPEMTSSSFFRSARAARGQLSTF